MKNIKYDKPYYESLIDDVLDVIKSYIKVYYKYNDDTFISMRRHCDKNNNKLYKPLPYHQLMGFVDEVLADLINFDFLYDFRELD